MKGYEEQVLERAGGRAFQEGRAVRAKALRLEDLGC